MQRAHLERKIAKFEQPENKMKRAIAVCAVAFTMFASNVVFAAETMSLALSDLLIRAKASGDSIDRVLHDFYAYRGYQPMWVGQNGRNPAARRVLSLLERSAGEGLNPSDYTVMLPPSADTHHLARDERNLSRAILRYAHHRAVGRISARQVGARYSRVAVAEPPEQVLHALATAIDPVQTLSQIGPQNEEFQGLLWAYSRLQRVVAAGGWSGVSEGPTIWPGTADLRVAKVRIALWQRGDYHATEPSASVVYDEQLGEAVRRFQRRHGLKDDGGIGKGTVRALNIPASTRLAQLRVNLERRRWQIPAPAERHIIVNLPAYEMAVMEGEIRTFTSPVVIGAKKHMTPEFSADMTYLVLNPHWYVRPSIANEEMLPELRKDPLTYVKKGFRAFASTEGNVTEVDWESVDWQATEKVPVYFRQESGNTNALGVVRFMWPNKDNIYLHDTPSKKLFGHARRAFSHGCIRVQDPMGLAAHLLEQKPEWSPDAILAGFKAGKRKSVSLDQSVHVRMLYHTAWVDADGTVNFRADVDGRDRELLRLLEPRA
jgi:murein L,D-transpeptidase YcbB/YkuD